MKTKEQILDWLDKQQWASEFYKTVFILRVNSSLSYNESFISNAFDWTATSSGTQVWAKRDTEFRKWYTSNDKPMSWETYCNQNPIKSDDYYIDIDCTIQYAITNSSEWVRTASTDANVMSKDLCEAFVAYMKLIQLRDAWVKDSDKNLCRIVWSPIKGFWCFYGGWNGLSFPTTAMADEFIRTFNDLLEVAKPLI